MCLATGRRMREMIASAVSMSFSFGKATSDLSQVQGSAFSARTGKKLSTALSLDYCGHSILH